jgi:hypothetical protein
MLYEKPLASSMCITMHVNCLTVAVTVAVAMCVAARDTTNTMLDGNETMNIWTKEHDAPVMSDTMKSCTSIGVTDEQLHDATILLLICCACNPTGAGSVVAAWSSQSLPASLVLASCLLARGGLWL